jgi:hypothetical protein
VYLVQIAVEVSSAYWSANERSVMETYLEIMEE